MKYLLLLIIKFYQLFISPILGNNCRFLPTCSEYSYESIQKYGFFKGLKLSIKRISKCHPWHKGGYDPVPPQTH
ncbi:Protein YidD [hydrothermal vent metagenome]|uniref:Protein YidD n=1 Tax=hydrothermal vent metagenome TaxID=652676 RepID=A0A1W1C926_9ZZZZ